MDRSFKKVEYYWFMVYVIATKSMKKITWDKEYDDDDNTIWVAASPYTDEDGAPEFFWRLKQRLRDDKIEWYEAHDAELLNIPEWGEIWTDLDKAKCYIETEHDKIFADSLQEDVKEKIEEKPDLNRKNILGDIINDSWNNN